MTQEVKKNNPNEIKEIRKQPDGGKLRRRKRVGYLAICCHGMDG